MAGRWISVTAGIRRVVGAGRGEPGAREGDFDVELSRWVIRRKTFRHDANDEVETRVLRGETQ